MTKFHALTRKVYEKQHDRIAGDKIAFDRIYNIYKGTTFGIDPRWWKGKKALDAGCGNFGAFMLRLVHLGVEKVHGIDLGKDWIDKMTRSLIKHGVARSKFELKPGSVLDIPYPDNYFDFVAINGVLLHLDSMAEIARGFSEGARVCKKGGYFFASFGPCGGAVQGAIFPALQKYYKENAVFHKFIDEINPQMIHKTIDKICADHKKHTGESVNARVIKSLFGLDFCVFLQNFIQRPTDFSNECTPQFVEKLYKANGFKSVVRLNHYVKRTDIRKFVAPLHYDRDYPISKVLYGEGYVQYIGKKS